MSEKKKFIQPLSVKPSQTAQDADKKRQAALEATRLQLAQSALSVSNPGAHGPMLAPSTDTPVVWVHIDEVETYEKNPRQTINEADEDIRHSLKTNGPEGVILVTRIPGRSRYVCAKGANTRLRIVKELWQETKDPRFEKLLVQIVMWKGHAAAITDHIIENTVRGDMTFWDKAKACWGIRYELTADKGTVPSGNELLSSIQAFGLSIDRATLSRYLHTAEHFGAIKTYCNNISVKALIPATNALLRLALKFELDEAQAWEDMHAALERFADGLDDGGFQADACIQALERSMAVRLQLSEHQLAFALSALERDPNAILQDLLTTATPPNTTLLQRPGQGPDETSLDPDDQPGELDSTQSTFPAPEKPFPKPVQNHSSAEAVARQLALEDDMQRAAFNPAPGQFVAGAGVQTTAGGTEPDAIRAPSGAAGAGTGGMAGKTLTVDEALDGVITAAADFAEVCHIGDWVVTGHAYPQGYFMEIRDCEQDRLPLLRDPIPGCDDARVRIGAWWLGASLSKQWSMEQTLLLPKNSGWRFVWGAENENVMSVEKGNLWSMIQDVMGGIIGDDGSPAVQIEYICAVMQAPMRARAFNTLTIALARLDAARGGRSTAEVMP